MRQIRLFIASSLDGYIARASGEVDWLFTDQDYGYAAFLAEVDTVLMGRKTYEQVLSFGEYPYSEKTSFVFSTALQGQRAPLRGSLRDRYVEFVGSNLVDVVESLRRSPGRDIWLVGGSQIIGFFLQQGWVDELILSIHPRILGSGIPLIPRDANLETALTLKEVKTYDSGLIQVSYTNLHRECGRS
jgi:dihydrofolate reductase